MCPIMGTRDASATSNHPHRRRHVHRRVLLLVLALGGPCALALGGPVEARAAGLIDTVNRQANVVDRRTQPLEVGGDPDGVWDCEDYALLKRRLLIKAGVSPADLHLWAVTTSRGTRHMVLEARGRILDNLSPWAIPREDVTYYSAWTPR